MSEKQRFQNFNNEQSQCLTDSIVELTNCYHISYLVKYFTDYFQLKDNI